MGRSRNRWWVVVGVLGVVLLLGGCAADANELAGKGEDPAGFWLGLWHGLIAPVTIIVSWFSDSVGIYEVVNNGGWYDTGFVLGASIIFGGGVGSGAAAGRRG
jgi:hypothetical protein